MTIAAHHYLHSPLAASCVNQRVVNVVLAKGDFKDWPYRLAEADHGARVAPVLADHDGAELASGRLFGILCVHIYLSIYLYIYIYTHIHTYNYI